MLPLSWRFRQVLQASARQCFVNPAIVAGWVLAINGLGDGRAASSTVSTTTAMRTVGEGMAPR
jgi:hypothetical protein